MESYSHRFSEWLRVGSQGSVHLTDGIPDRAYACDDGLPCAADMAAQVERKTGLRVRVGSWRDGGDSEHLEADLIVAPEDFGEVLARLAVASARTYWDRYRQCLGDGDTDYLDEAFAADFNRALALCGLRWGQVDAREHMDRYGAIVRRLCGDMAAGMH